jgi:two-component system chemotaxis sensor kinase CheA
MTELSKEDLDQLYPIFRDQTLEILDGMSDDLLAVESGAIDEELIARLKRGAHTIKGDAACIGLERISDVAHGIEDYLDDSGDNSSVFNKRIVTRLLSLVDAIRGAVLNDHPTDLREGMDEALVVQPEEGVREEGVRKAVKQARNVIRIDAAKVDDLLNLAGEMMVARSELEQASREIDLLMQDEMLASRLRHSVDKFSGLIARFQKVALKMRMVPVATLFRRYSRAMRDIACELGKSVELEWSNEKTELDRHLVELLYEPILHLLRNAIDHGIEPIEERKEAGKNPTGLVQMRAFHEAEEVVLEISDDGRGIDLDRLKQKACELGLLDGRMAQVLTDEESARLVFSGGISTAREITKLSGRGIGGAAVKSMVDQARGTISVRTERGKGTTFTLRVPLTLSIMRSLLFSAGGQLFALPVAAIREVVQIDETAVFSISGIDCYRIQGRLVSVIKPGEGYKDDKPEDEAIASEERLCKYLVVVISGGKEFAILTEAVRGVEELVVKPFDSNGRVRRGSLYVGGAVLGNGEVVLIYDARALYDKSLNRSHYKGKSELEYAS